MTFTRLDDAERITDLLYVFAPTFPHLKEKVSNYRRYAEKLALYAETYCFSQNEQEAIGFLSFYSNDNINHVGYIALIGIQEKYRQKGFGKELLEFAERTMIQNGMNRIKLEVDNDNLPAIRFYTAHGYCKESKATESSRYLIKTINKVVV